MQYYVRIWVNDQRHQSFGGKRAEEFLNLFHDWRIGVTDDCPIDRICSAEVLPHDKNRREVWIFVVKRKLNRPSNRRPIKAAWMLDCIGRRPWNLKTFHIPDSPEVYGITQIATGGEK